MNPTAAGCTPCHLQLPVPPARVLGGDRGGSSSEQCQHPCGKGSHPSQAVSAPSACSKGGAAVRGHCWGAMAWQCHVPAPWTGAGAELEQRSLSQGGTDLQIQDLAELPGNQRAQPGTIIYQRRGTEHHALVLNPRSCGTNEENDRLEGN